MSKHSLTLHRVEETLRGVDRRVLKLRLRERVYVAATRSATQRLRRVIDMASALVRVLRDNPPIIELKIKAQSI